MIHNFIYANGFLRYNWNHIESWEQHMDFKIVISKNSFCNQKEKVCTYVFSDFIIFKTAGLLENYSFYF